MLWKVPYSTPLIHSWQLVLAPMISALYPLRSMILSMPRVSDNALRIVKPSGAVSALLYNWGGWEAAGAG
jgi:hypothetical protein